MWDFKNAKTVDVYAGRATTTEYIAKGMIGGSLAYLVGLERYTWGH